MVVVVRVVAAVVDPLVSDDACDAALVEEVEAVRDGWAPELAAAPGWDPCAAEADGAAAGAAGVWTDAQRRARRGRRGGRKSRGLAEARSVRRAGAGRNQDEEQQESPTRAAGTYQESSGPGTRRRSFSGIRFSWSSRRSRRSLSGRRAATARRSRSCRGGLPYIYRRDRPLREIFATRKRPVAAMNRRAYSMCLAYPTTEGGPFFRPAAASDRRRRLEPRRSPATVRRSFLSPR